MSEESDRKFYLDYEKKRLREQEEKAGKQKLWEECQAQAHREFEEEKKAKNAALPAVVTPAKPAGRCPYCFLEKGTHIRNCPARKEAEPRVAGAAELKAELARLTGGGVAPLDLQAIDRVAGELAAAELEAEYGAIERGEEDGMALEREGGIGAPVLMWGVLIFDVVWMALTSLGLL